MSLSTTTTIHDGSSSSSLPLASVLTKQLLGLIGPISRSVITSPFNRVRIILQTQNDTIKKEQHDDDENNNQELSNKEDDNNQLKSTSNNFIECGRKLIRQEGITSLWRGFPAQLASVLLVHYTTLPLTKFAIYNISSSPFVISILNSLVSYPMEQCKTILLAGNHGYSGIIDYFVKRSDESGLLSHYHGFIAYVVGGLIYRRTFPIIYELLRSLRPLYIERIPKWGVVLSELLMAQLCIASASALAYPLDTISRRIQLQGCKKSEERKFTNSIQCLKKIVKEEGVLSLYNGFGAHCLSAFSLTLLTLTLYYTVGN